MAVTKKEGSALEGLLKKYAAKKDVTCVDTKIDFLNDLLGGGIHLGSMSVFWGIKGCFKTTCALQIMKAFLKQDYKVLFVDAEKSFNESQQETFGLKEYVESGKLVILVADNFADLEEIVDGVIEDGSFNLVVIDSVTEIRSFVDKGLKVTDVRPGLRAQQESHVLGKMKSGFYKKDIASICILQARANIIIQGSNYGAPAEKAAGGYSQEHLPDTIVKVQLHSKIKDTENNIVGVECTFMAEKCKFAMPYRPFRKKMYFGKGIDKRRDVIDSCLDKEIIKQSGSYFDLPNGDRIRGREELYKLDDKVLVELKKYL